MKKILRIVVLVLLLNTTAFSEGIKLKEIKLDTDNQKFKKIKSYIRGNIEGIDFMNYFYEYREGNNLKGFVDIFDLDNAGLYQGRVNMWFRSQVYAINKKQACINSDRNIFFKDIDLNKNITCLNIKIIDKDELSTPNFKPHHQVSLFRRTSIIKNFIKKNEIIVPNKMIRAEHYFYKAGQVNWIIFSLDVDINSEEEINKFIIQTFQNHKNFEKQLKIPLKNHFEFQNTNFTQKKTIKEKKKKEKKQLTDFNKEDIASQIKSLKDLLDAGVITEEEFVKAKKKILN